MRLNNNMTREEMKKKYSIENMIRSKNDFSLEVYFGNMCNYNCSYCFDAYTRKKHWSNWNKEQTDKCLKFIDSVKTLYDVNIYGGEPSMWKYCLYFIDNIRSDVHVSIITNGSNPKFTKDVCELSKRNNRQLLYCMSVHYEKYLENKEKFMENLRYVYHTIENYKDNVALEFVLLLDQKNTYKYMDLVNLLLREGNKNTFSVTLSYIRRTQDAEECIKNYCMIPKLDKDVQEKAKKLFSLDRFRIAEKNLFYHRKCPQFYHHAEVQFDGRLLSTDCKQGKLSKKSIFDDDFNLEDEQFICECCQEHEKNNYSCEKVHGMLNNFDNVFEWLNSDIFDETIEEMNKERLRVSEWDNDDNEKISK